MLASVALSSLTSDIQDGPGSGQSRAVQPTSPELEQTQMLQPSFETCCPGAKRLPPTVQYGPLSGGGSVSQASSVHCASPRSPHEQRLQPSLSGKVSPSA